MSILISEKNPCNTVVLEAKLLYELVFSLLAVAQQHNQYVTDVTILLGKPQKRPYPPPSSLVATFFSEMFFFELRQNTFFLSGPALTKWPGHYQKYF